MTCILFSGEITNKVIMYKNKLTTRKRYSSEDKACGSVHSQHNLCLKQKVATEYSTCHLSKNSLIQTLTFLIQSCLILYMCM